jgi:hypothetical protein
MWLSQNCDFTQPCDCNSTHSKSEGQNSNRKEKYGIVAKLEETPSAIYNLARANHSTKTNEG